MALRGYGKVMAYEVLVDPVALDRVDEIVGYVSEVLGSPSAALGILDGFDELVAKLELMPLSYPRAHDERLAARGYRRALVGNYVILFRVDESAEQEGTVYVTNVFHGSQDYPRLV